MPPRTRFPDRAEQEDRDDQDLLRRLEHQHGTLVDRRHELINEVRRISSEQKSLYDRRQAPQADVERLYEEVAQLGKRLGELRALREKALAQVESKVIERRELLLKIGPSEPPRPDALRKEIAELERRQQTSALPIEEENALIALVRQRTKELKDAEAHAAVLKQHVDQRRAADSAILEARGAVERIVEEMERSRIERNLKMAEVRAKLELAGGMVAEMRAKGRARADLMTQVDNLGREIAALELEGREVFQRLKSRRDDARRTMRAFAPSRERPPADLAATAADRRFEELMKRGKVSING
ncbi:MAG: hypothetical protein ACLQD8_06650 [Thermoplasmata archaeon]